MRIRAATAPTDVMMLEDSTSDEDPSTTEVVMKTRAAEAWIEDLKNTLLAKREC